MEIIINIKDDNKDKVFLEAKSLSDPNLRDILYSYIKPDDTPKEEDNKEKTNPVYFEHPIVTKAIYECLVEPLRNFYIEKIKKYPDEKSYVQQIIMIDEVIPSAIIKDIKVINRKAVKSIEESIEDFMKIALHDNRYDYYKVKNIFKNYLHIDIDEYESNVKEKWETIRKLLNNEKSKSFIKDMADKIEKVYGDSIRGYKPVEVTEVGRIRLFIIYLRHHNILDKLEFSSKYPEDDVIECLKDFLRYSPKYFEITKEYTDFMRNLKILFNIEGDDLIEY